LFKKFPQQRAEYHLVFIRWFVTVVVYPILACSYVHVSIMFVRWCWSSFVVCQIFIYLIICAIIYLDKLYNWYPLTISLTLNVSRHNPIHVLSLSTISHVSIHQTIYLCLRRFSVIILPPFIYPRPICTWLKNQGKGIKSLMSLISPKSCERGLCLARMPKRRFSVFQWKTQIGLA
jgi:hypothetical protein